MSFIKRILYGILIGIASIAPGLSGGTIAIALGFYENLVSAVANIFKNFRKHFSYLLPFGIGAVVSIAALSVVFDYMFAEFPLPTNLLFIGFILGTLPFIRTRFKTSLNSSRASWKHTVVGILFLIIVIIPVFTGGTAETGAGALTGETGTPLMFLMIGMIIAATLVIPGLSGTMILTSLGFYKPLLHTASTFVTAAVTMDITSAAAMMTSIIPLGLGVLMGGVLVAKLLDKLFKVIPSYIYAAVIGLLCATPFVMLAGITAADISAVNIIIGIAALAAGLFSGWKLGEKEQ